MAKFYVAGYTASTNFPTTNYVQQLVGTNYYDGHRLNGSTNAFNEADDAFVTAFDSTDSTNLTMLYSTLLGGTNSDLAFGITADTNGNAYVVGATVSYQFSLQRQRVDELRHQSAVFRPDQ